MTNANKKFKCPIQYEDCPHKGKDYSLIPDKCTDYCGRRLRGVPSQVWVLAVLVALGGGYFTFKDQIRNLISSSSTDTPTQPSPTHTVDTCRRIADVRDVPQGTFNYGGSTTFAPLREGADIFKRLREPDVIATIKEAHPQFNLRYTHPPTGKSGSGRGIEMLLTDQLSFAESSRPVKDEEFKQAQDRNFKLEQIPVAIDGIAFYVNPELINQGIKDITLPQVRDIFLGKIKNWKELGGPDVAIVPFSRNLEAGGTVDFFFEEVIKKSLGSNESEEELKKRFRTHIKEIEDTTSSIRQVASIPGGIGYATASEVINQERIRPLPLAKDTNSSFLYPCQDDSCTSVNKTVFANDSYPLTRRLFVVIKRNGQLDERAGVAYAHILLCDQGQKLIEKAGFVPIR